MRIYIAHSTSFDYKNELYQPIKQSSLFRDNEIIFPHDSGEEIYNSKELFKNGCDLVIAEVSYPSIGLGIELGWADFYNIPIVCIYKTGSKISQSLNAVSDKFFKYSNEDELIKVISEMI